MDIINPAITESIAQRLTSQIADEQISSICMRLSSLKVEVLYRRIVLEEQFDEISESMKLPQKKIEAEYYNSIRKIRNELRRNL